MISTAAQQATSTAYKAVCYQCHFVARDCVVGCCPACGFPLIFKPRHDVDSAPQLVDIFDRSSMRLGAPPLPGVDVAPRKAQLLAEARKRRATPPAGVEATALVELATESGPTRGQLRSLGNVMVALCSAAAVGLVAAVLQSGF